MITQQKARIEWIDCLRGLTMILVIYHHMMDYRFCGVAYSPLDTESNLNNFVMLIRMPLFFFVSGFIAYNGGGYTTVSWLKEKCLKRLLKQFIPTIVIGGIFLLSTDGTTIEGFFFGPPTRYGYWFTITLFETFIIFAVLNYLCDRFKCSKLVKTVAFVFAILVLTKSFQLCVSHFESPVIDAIGFKQVAKYIRFFFIGATAKIYLEQFMKLIQNQIIMAVIFIALVVLSILKMQEIIEIPYTIIPLLGIASMFSIFYYFREIFSSQTRIGRAMSYVGKNTLPIYLLHYFFIVGLIGLQDSVLHQLVQSSWVLELIIVMSFAIVIAVGCLFVEKTLQAVPIVHSILFGFDHKKKKS